MKRLPHYSQHFLRNPQLIKELIGHTSIKAGDTVYDIGAGSGVISSVLATRCKAVVAVEPEPRMAEKLRRNMQAHPSVTVIERDFLAVSLPDSPYKIFANIPFHLSSPIIRKLAVAGTPPEAAYLITQKQFAYKLLVDNGKFTGLLGTLIGPIFTVRVRRHLQKTDFWPHPAVDTVFLELLRRPQPFLPAAQMPQFERFITQCYSDPRYFAATPLKAVVIDRTLRPSQLELSDWLNLFKAFLHFKR